jgi:hypothetical protein
LKNQLKQTEKPLLRDQDIIFIIIDGLLENFRGGWLKLMWLQEIGACRKPMAIWKI